MTERNYSTRITNDINEEDVTEINNVIAEFISTKGNLTFWEINVIHYCAAITVIDRRGKVKELNKPKRTRKKDGWRTQLQEQINSIRRKISQIQVTLKCLERDTVQFKTIPL